MVKLGKKKSLVEHWTKFLLALLGEVSEIVSFVFSSKRRKKSLYISYTDANSYLFVSLVSATPSSIIIFFTFLLMFFPLLND